MTWIGLILLALVLVPAPLLPPHWLAEAVRSAFGVGWKAAYLVTATGLHTLFYGSLGVLASLAVERAPTIRQRLLQIGTVPLIVVGVALLVRSVKLGHMPMLANAAIPMVACFAGAGLGLGLLYRKWKLSLAVSVVMTFFALWALLGRAPAELSRATESNLRRLVNVSSSLPAGEARFGSLWQVAFAPGPTNSPPQEAVQQNRAAILALGIAIGHERLARLAGLERQSRLVQEAAALRRGLTIRGREDWARHYALSAALAILDHPLVSDAGGLLKEQLDALTGGSGFSFGDLAADRAGVRFAEVATRSEADAEAIRERISGGFLVDDFFPQISDLPEGLTVEQFRTEYGGVGSTRYREQVREIETRLGQCAALSVL
jgi:hypothetical protein